MNSVAKFLGNFLTELTEHRPILSGSVLEKTSLNFLFVVRDRPLTPWSIDEGIRCASFQMGLTHSKYPPKNQKSGFRLIFLGVY